MTYLEVLKKKIEMKKQEIRENPNDLRKEIELKQLQEEHRVISLGDIKE